MSDVAPRNVSYRFVEDPLGHWGIKAAARIKGRIGIRDSAQSASGEAHQTPKTPRRSNSPSEPPEATSMPFLTFKDTVKFARYLHDACYAANENLSAVESSAVLMGSFGRRLW